jgi:small-conductance mechanosensitive channel
MTELQRFMEMEFLDNTLLSWGLALVAFLVTFTVLPMVRGYIGALRKRKPVHEHTALDLAMVLITRTSRLFLIAVALWAGTQPLDMPQRVEEIADRAMLVIWWLQVGLWLMRGATYLIDRRRGLDFDRADHGAAGSVDIIHFVVRLTIWAVVLLVALDNLGIEVTTLVAGLGIGGIAVALAVQNVLGDLFASLSITFDKPFVVGDVLAIDKDVGTVEQIGVKSTRLRSVDGEQIIISNADLLKARLHNFGRLYERRMLFNISVRYETPPDVVRAIPGLLAEIVREQQPVRFDRSHLVRYSDFALVFEVVYFVLDANGNLALDIQQAINLRIFEEFGRRGIVFSYRERQLPPPRDADDGDAAGET